MNAQLPYLPCIRHQKRKWILIMEQTERFLLKLYLGVMNLVAFDKIKLFPKNLSHVFITNIST